MNSGQVAQDTAHKAPQTERAHWGTGAKWPRTPHTLQNAPSEHISEQETSGPEHGTGNETPQADAPVTRSQVAEYTAHAAQHSEHAHW